MPTAAEPLLQVRDLRTWFLTDSGPVRAVDGVSFDVHAGETLGVVGESGSGKSVCAKSIMRLLDEPARIVGGSILFKGRDLAHLDDEGIRAVRGREIAMVFQDPMTSLNPVLRIARQLVEAMTAHGRFTGPAARSRAIDLLRRMGVASADSAVNSFPHQFSGGMRQRVMLAMGFSNEPSLLIADEPTTALDVTIQAQILDLLRGLNRDLGTAVILISHDLGVIANICSRVLVMYAGEVVEEGAPEDLLTDPRHPYTWALLHAAPRIDAQTEDRRLITIEGQPPDPRAWPSGCRFRARCPFAIEKCAEHPELLPVEAGRAARCWVTQEGGSLHTPERARAGGGAAVAAPVDPPPAVPILEVSGLQKHFPLAKETFFARQRVLRAVDGVDLQVLAGETVGLVGEFGLRQVDSGAAGHAAARTDGGQDHLCRHGHHPCQPVGDPPAAATHADDLPGPVRIAQSAHDDRRDPRRSADPARHRRRCGSGPHAGGRAARPRRPAAPVGATLSV